MSAHTPALDLPTHYDGIVPERWERLGSLILQQGSHNPPRGEELPSACVMEAVAWLDGEYFTDRPACVSPVLHAPFQRLNDRWPDDRRQMLLPLGIQAMGTAGDGLDDARRQVAWDALPDLLVPWLRLAELDVEADAIVAAVGDVAAMRAALRAASDAAREARWTARAALRKRVEKKVREAAAAAAAAVAVAVDVADAAAAAVAVAVAVAVADADAVAADAAVAVAVADAAADAAAVAVDVAVAAADDAWVPSGSAWNRVYDAVRKHHFRLPAEVTELVEAQRDAALRLLERLIDPTREATS